MIKRTIGTLFAACLIALTTSTAYAQAKWWWEKYPTANDKTLNLQGASGGSVVAKQNPTGANGSVAGNTATQPPTVIIQQTASATPSSQLTCVQTVTPAAGGGSYGTTISVCPNIVGYTATPIIGGGYSTSYISHYSNSTSIINNPILACCYVPVTGVTAGGAAYSPWSANQAFNSNGFSGNQKQEFLTPGTFSWTVPSGVYRVWATVVGGGGGGGAGAFSPNHPSYAYPGGGGGRGGTGYRRPIDVIPGSTLTVVVGAAGAGGSGTSYIYAGRSGSPGGSSYVTVSGYTVEAQGGYAGVGGYEATGYYANNPPNPTPFVITDGRSTNSCGNSNCTGQGGIMGYLAVGSGSPIAGGADGQTGRGAAMGQAYGDGNTYNPTGAGKSGSGSGGYGGGGGAAGFIGMPYSTNVPYAANGTSNSNSYGATSGMGGYGYGAGGGGGHGGGYTNTNFGNGASGAPGAAWIEW